MRDNRLEQQRKFTQYNLLALLLFGIGQILLYLVLFTVLPSDLLAAHQQLWALIAGLLSLPFSFALTGLFIKPALLEYTALRRSLQGVVSIVVFAVVLWLWHRADFAGDVLEEETAVTSDVELL